MCSIITPHLPLPPSPKVNKSYTSSRSGSLIKKPKKGTIQMSNSTDKMPVLTPMQLLKTRSQTSRNSSVNSKQISKNLKENILKKDANGHEIRIRVFSNYGHPSLISCSEIDVINDQKQTVPICSISLEPKGNTVNRMINDSNRRLDLKKSRSATNLNDLYDFSKLTNGSIMENNEFDYWHAAWPPEFPMKYIDIVLIAKTPSKIDSLRIWPNKIDDSQNFKHISIFLDQHLLYNNELQNDFGLVIPLQMFDSHGNSRIIGSQEQISRISDDYGIIPVRATSNVEIDFLRAYCCSDQCGLQMIKMYDSNGDAIDFQSKGMIQCISCGDEAAKNIMSVFAIKEFDPTFKWICELNHDSKLLIKFVDPIIISAIMITTLPESFSQIDLAIKQIRIKRDGINIWCGKIDRWEENTLNAIKRTNIIYLYDISNLKEKINNDVSKSLHQKQENI